MSSLLLSAMVRRLLLDRIEATVYSSTVSGDSKKAAMHVHVATFPYLDVTNISIRQPCLSFTVYSSPMLPPARCAPGDAQEFDCNTIEWDLCSY